MNIRKGKTVAKVEQHRPGYEELAGMLLTVSTKEYDSISQAKKANGLNAKTLRKGESFPPTAVHDAMRGRHESPEGEVRPGRDSPQHAGWWLSEPDVGRVANGVADRVDRLRGLGNGQVPAVAAMAFRLLAPESTE